MTTRYITFGVYMQRHNDIRDNVAFSIEIMFTLKDVKFNDMGSDCIGSWSLLIFLLFKWSYDKQNLTFVVISYEIYETRLRLVS